MEVTKKRINRRTFVQGSIGAAALGILAACAGQPAAAPTAPAAQPTQPPAAAAPTTAPAPAPTQAPAATAAPAAQPTRPPAAATQAPAAAATQPATAAGRPGGSIVMGLEADPLNMDPHKNGAFSGLFALEHTYQSLVTFDENLRIIPQLALSWENPNPQTYIFNLRPNVKFHNGHEFTAEDVVFWYERMMDPATAAPYKGWYDAVTNVTAVDKLTAKFDLQYPYSPLLSNFAAMRGGAIVPKTWALETGDLNRTAVGTGPYKMTEYLAQSHYIWEKNPDYWQQGVPFIDRVENKVMLEETSRAAALQSGQILYAPMGGELATRLQGRPDLRVMISQKAWYWHMQANLTREPFTDVRVRRAMDLVIDRKEIIDKVLGGFGDLTGPIPTGHTDWWIPIEQLPYKVDVAQAKQLLAEAGHPNGFKTTYKAVSTSPVEVPVGVIIQQQLKQIGIDMEIIQMDATQWVRETQPPTSNYELRLNGNSFYPDADGYMYNHYYSKANFNQVRVNDPKLDELVVKARQELDHEERRKIYYEVQNLILDQVYVYPLFNGKNIEVLSSKLEGYKQSYTGRRLFFPQTWLKD